MRYIRPAAGVLWMIAKRIAHNHRLVLAMLLGFIVAVGVVASIPIFASGSLQRVLQNELTRDSQPGRQAAAITVSHFANEKRPTKPEQFDRLEEFIAAHGRELLAVQIDPLIRYGTLDVTFASPVDESKVDPNVPRWVAVGFLGEFERHARMLDGRLYQEGVQPDGAVETIVSERMMDKFQITVGSEFWLPVSRADGAPRLKLRVVGVYRDDQPGDRYYPVSGPLDQVFLVPEKTFRQHVMRTEKALVNQYSFYFGVEAASVDLGNLERFMAGLFELESRVQQLVPDTGIFGSPLDALYRYARKAYVLRMLLLILSAPLLCLTAYYLLVTSNLMLQRQKAEIAVMRSRGAGLFQIVGIYALEGLVYGGLALLIGPHVGVLLAKVMGATAGFVQFVDRKPLPIILDGRASTYSLYTVLLAILFILIPAVQAARESIVTYKMQAARQNRAPWWQRYFLDVGLLGASLYGWYAQRLQFEARMQVATPASKVPEVLVEPLHFILPALFIASVGLVMLRALPYVTGLLDRLTRRRGGPALHLALSQVARAPGNTAPVILLLTLTVGLGLYGASAARTLEQNYEDKAYHQTGADVALHEVWEYDDTTNTYYEPPFQVHHALPGVEAAARVYIHNGLSAFANGKSVGKGTMMALDPQEFAQVARFRSDLYRPYHPNNYLNLLGKDEEAVLVTPDFLSRNRLRPGDRISLRDTGREVTLVIYGAVPYWPALYGGKVAGQDFFVANLEYIQTNFGLRPYQVWLRLDPSVTDLRPLTRKLAEQNIFVLHADDARLTLAETRRDPQRTGLSGVLTVGFIISASLTVLGFLLYAVLSLRSRLLQLGVLRAMGLSTGQLLGALGLEQVYTVGMGMLAGTGLGLLASRLFVPFLQLGGAVHEQIPPFRIVTSSIDQVRLYGVLGVMLLLGLVSLGIVIKQMQINNAVKLGEDS